MGFVGDERSTRRAVAEAYGSISGQPFWLESTNGVITLTPKNGSAVVGVFVAVSDPTDPNNSCLNGTAKRFVVTGVVLWS
ncbi:MAG TPA: hypothetical protein VM287_00390 [Egibacteraceae bacterium]|nr:hypothetical protein [Egibacteraceae bacterium]